MQHFQQLDQHIRANILQKFGSSGQAVVDTELSSYSKATREEPLQSFDVLQNGIATRKRM